MKRRIMRVFILFAFVIIIYGIGKRGVSVVEVVSPVMQTGDWVEKIKEDFLLEKVNDREMFPFLTYDWTSEDVLMNEHCIEPEDSGRGWEFAVADIDFDGIQEMLISFPAKHCGQNCLYIYKQDNGKVVLYVDTIATFERHVVSDIDYKGISPYLDIDLLTAYQNVENEYRYFSLDYSHFGGGVGTITLYETIFRENSVPKKLLEISYSICENKQEMYFCGERIYEIEELRDRLNDYMHDYSKVEIEYEIAKKSLARDIVTMDEEVKKKELDELYDALTELLNRKDANTDGVEQYYGTYKIVQFCPTKYYEARDYDVLHKQEADMMLGRIVTIKENLFITCDSERVLGMRDGQMAFPGNYMITRFSIENPQYCWNTIDTPVTLEVADEFEGAIGTDYFEKINGSLSIQIASPFGTHEYYSMKDEDKLIMASGLTDQYFILEKLEEGFEEKVASEMTTEEKESVLEYVYGSYIITEFLPTKFYPAVDTNGDVLLPKEEADLMLGREVIIGEDVVMLYDNFRLPNSEIVNRSEDEYLIKEIKIESPNYQVERKLRSDIYGLKDDVLKEEFVQEKYIEINVYPGYETNGERILPQMYLLDDGRILMYSMGEYFLLEKKYEEVKEEIDDYMAYFIELYTTSMLNEGANTLMHVEEKEIELDNGGNTIAATLVEYEDSENNCLRYKIEMYGETMNTVINYYYCKDFVFIIKQNNYYSSWILTEAEQDILYSEMNRWIIKEDEAFVLEDNGRLSEIGVEQMSVPTLEEVEMAIN